MSTWIAFWCGLYRSGLGVWCVLLRERGTLIGVTGVKPRQDHDDLELKYNFARSFWGRGFGTEAAAAALRLVEADAVVATIDARNERSKRVAGKLGFRLERTFRARDLVVELWRRPVPAG